MRLTKLISMIYEELLQFIPVFRIVWAGTIALGIAMLIIALILKKNSRQANSPWVVGGVGLLLLITSGTQLIASIF